LRQTEAASNFAILAFGFTIFSFVRNFAEKFPMCAIVFHFCIASGIAKTSAPKAFKRGIKFLSQPKHVPNYRVRSRSIPTARARCATISPPGMQCSIRINFAL
jgi:hypothetical protein